MELVGKIAKIVMYVLMILGVGLAALTVFGPSVEAEYWTPEFLGLIIDWTIGVLVGAILLVIVFELVHVILNPSNAVKTVIMLVAGIAVVGLLWALSDGTKLNIVGYEGSDNSEIPLKIADTGIYLCYVLFGAAVASIVASEVYQLFK